jgi:hypothetical protein
MDILWTSYGHPVDILWTSYGHPTYSDQKRTAHPSVSHQQLAINHQLSCTLSLLAMFTDISGECSFIEATG